MTEKISVRLPRELLLQAKRKAAAEGRTLESLIEEGLRIVVSEAAPTARKKRVMLPVSSATGGFLVDISNSAALQEIEDLEYIERMKHFK